MAMGMSRTGVTLTMRVALVAIALGGASAAAAQPRAYVLGDRTSSGLVTVIDTATGAKVGSIPVATRGGTFSDAMAAAPDGGRIYLVNPDDDTVIVIDTASNTVVGTLPAGPDPKTIAVSPDGSRLYVGNSTGLSSQTAIRVMSAVTGATLGSIPLGTPQTLGLAVSPDGRRLYATGWTGMSTGYTLKVVDTEIRGVIASIPMPTFALDVAVTSDGARVYVSSLTIGTGTVTVVDALSLSAVTAVPVGVNPQSLAVAPDGRRVFVANNGVPFSVSILDRASNTVTAQIPGPTHMRAIAFTADGRRALASADGGVAILDAVTNATAGFVPMDLAVEGNPRAIVVLPMPPEPPTDLFAAAVAGNVVTLHWRAPASGPIPTGYAVEGGTVPGEALASLLTGSSRPAHTFTAPSGVFYVRVRALVGAVRSEPSNEIVLPVNPPLPPAAPEGLAGVVSGSSVELSWRSSGVGGAPQQILLDVTGSAETTIVLPAGETFAFAGVPPGTYTLAVRAVNVQGSSAPSNRVTLSFPGTCSGVPAPPEQVRVYKAGGQVFVYWQPAITGPATTGYVLRVTGGYVGAFATSARTLNGVVNSGTYHISVAGTNACGEGAPSAIETITVP